MHDLLSLGRNTNGTTDANDQCELGHGRDVESTLNLRLATVGNGGLVGGLVFRGVLFGGCYGILLVLALLLLGLVGGLLGLIGDLGLGGLLLEDGFGNGGRHGEIVIEQRMLGDGSIVDGPQKIAAAERESAGEDMTFNQFLGRKVTAYLSSASDRLNK